MADTEVSFVLAFPGWEVLYYFRGGRFESAPIVAWAIHAVEGSFARAVPVTTDMAWSLEDDRPICTPDGDVTLGDLERWPSVWAWLDDMKKREVNNPESLPPTPSIPLGNKRGAPVLALDSFRGKFER
jgi:hypothetical protein